MKDQARQRINSRHDEDLRRELRRIEKAQDRERSKAETAKRKQEQADGVRQRKLAREDKQLHDRIAMEEQKRLTREKPWKLVSHHMVGYGSAHKCTL